jgi:hypothetical protein
MTKVITFSQMLRAFSFSDCPEPVAAPRRRQPSLNLISMWIFDLSRVS